MFDAILDQVECPKNYTASMLRNQALYYLMRHINYFDHHVQPLLKLYDMEFHSYILNVLMGNIWGDVLLLSVVSRMWNVEITIVSPEYTDKWNVFHKSEDPSIVLIFNGADFFARVPVTPISSTGMY